MQLEDYWVLARCDRVRFDLPMLDLLHGRDHQIPLSHWRHLLYFFKRGHRITISPFFGLSSLSQKYNILHLQPLVRRIFLTQPRLTNTTRTISRSRLNSRLHDGLNFDFASWEIISRDNWRNDRYIRKPFRLAEWIVVPLQAVAALLQSRFWTLYNCCFVSLYPLFPFLFPSTPQSFFYPFNPGELSRYS